MAHVVTATTEQIDHWLTMLMEAWDELPVIDVEFAEWDPVVKDVFILEWPLQTMKLEKLERVVAARGLNREQQQRYRELQRLMERNRQILERISLARRYVRDVVEGVFPPTIRETVRWLT